MRIASSLWVLSLVLAAAATARAQEKTYKVDPVHSMVVFRIEHMGLSFVYGRFNDPAGTFVISDDPEKMAFDVQVEVKNIDTNNDRRDADLRSEKYFDAKQFPAIHFKSTGVKKTADKKYDVTGEMTLHGVTKTITVSMDFVGEGAGPDKKQRAGFETKFTVKRSDYGMNAKGVGDEVQLMINLEGVQEEAQ